MKNKKMHKMQPLYNAYERWDWLEILRYMLTYVDEELVGVLTTEPINRFLDYYAPIGGVSVGDFVEVNLGPRKVIGCVWSKG